MSSTQLTDEWIVEGFIRLAKPGEDADVYEPWPGYDAPMTQLDECAKRRLDLEFRAHRLLVHEKLAREAIRRASEASKDER
ncbi:hypothetical protein [Cupriavidus sp. D39]|uniref:hypothetical protein n=1 Tax=Cupriavidus sp. D39 TaxID=2997877 RepID=UPI00226DB19D|nr:hypothetical protein [Cupriavidus sp. D39]MCY0852543.1 hypothetical protein [Cupriavidus sp. D39]